VRELEAKDRIIVAMDVKSLEEAEPIIDMLAPYVGCFKVGLELMARVGGPQAVKFVHDRGGQVFYDGKFDDIPNTVAEASKAVSELGVKMFNVHASAGDKAVKAAAENKGESLLLGVTVLTSIDEIQSKQIFGQVPREAVSRLTEMAVPAGLDGIICSPADLDVFRENLGFAFDTPIKVTPGIRPEWATKDDQSRITTPKKAIRGGADFLVIGRPILRPPAEIGTPVDAAQMIADEIQSALAII